MNICNPIINTTYYEAKRILFEFDIFISQNYGTSSFKKQGKKFLSILISQNSIFTQGGIDLGEKVEKFFHLALLISEEIIAEEEKKGWSETLNHRKDKTQICAIPYMQVRKKGYAKVMITGKGEI